MIYLLLAFEFFKIGLFSFGGGYATIPFLYDISVRYGWYTLRELTNMTSVASITPGPIGINVATYAGVKVDGIFGALIATISEVIPSLILVILISKILKKYNDNFYIKSILQTLKPISCALLSAVVIGFITPEIENIKSIILLIFLLALSWRTKKEPLFYMLIGGAIGIIDVIIKIS